MLRTYPAVPLFFYALTLPYSYFSTTLPCCALIFSLRLPCCALIFLRIYSVHCCAYPAVLLFFFALTLLRLPYFALIFLRTYPAALTLLCPKIFFRAAGWSKQKAG